MPHEQVDDAALGADRKRNLRLEDPVRQRLVEPGDDRLMQAGVTGIDEAVEVGAARPRADRHLDVQTAGDPKQGADRDGLEVPTLDTRHDGAVRAGASADIRLSPAALDPDGPEPGAQRLPLIHPRQATG